MTSSDKSTGTEMDAWSDVLEGDGASVDSRDVSVFGVPLVQTVLQVAGAIGGAIVASWAIPDRSSGRGVVLIILGCILGSMAGKVVYDFVGTFLQDAIDTAIPWSFS